MPTAGPGEQAGDTIDPDTGEIVDSDGSVATGGNDDAAEDAQDEFASGGDYFDDDFNADPSPGGARDASDSGGDSDRSDDDDDDSVPEFDGRKTTISGPEAPSNPTDSTQVVVDDRAGEDGQPTRDPTDDAFVPDNVEGLENEVGNLTGRTPPSRERLSEAVERLEGDLARAGGGAVVTGEKEAFNIRQTGDGRIQGEFTERTLDELAGTQGVRTVAGRRVPEAQAAEPTRSSLGGVDEGRAEAAQDAIAGGDLAGAGSRSTARGSAEAAADVSADETAAVQADTIEQDAARDPTLIRAEEQARREQQLRELGLGETEAFGDADLSFGTGGRGDEVEQFTDEVVAGGAEDVASQTGLDTPFGSARDAVNAERTSERTQAGLEPDPLTEAAFRLAGDAPNLPARGVEAVETGLFLTGGTPAAGGSEQEFDERLGEIATAVEGRGEAFAASAQRNPERAAADIVVGSLAEGGAVGLAGRAARIGGTADVSRTTAARQAVEQTTPSTPDVDLSTQRSFVADARGQAELTGAPRSDLDTESLPDEIAGTNPNRRRPANLGTGRDRPSPLSPERNDGPRRGDLGSETSPEATVRADTQLENLRRMGLADDPELRARAADLPTDDLRRLVDVERRLGSEARSAVAPEVGPAVGGLLGTAESAARSGEPAALVTTDQEAESAFAAQEPELEPATGSFDDLGFGVGAEGAAAGIADLGATQTGTATATDSGIDARGRTDLEQRIGLRTEARQQPRLDQRQETRTETRTRSDTRTETRAETRVDSEFRFESETRADGDERPPEPDDDEPVPEGFGLRADEFTNPVTTPEEFLEQTFGGDGR